MSKYNDFLIILNEYEGFVGDCFRTYTKGWNGHPGIESIEFSGEGAYICYSVWDDKESLSIPLALLESKDSYDVVKLWKDTFDKEQQEKREKEAKEEKARDLAEFNRLKEKIAHIE